jgi:pimeloyl-ACP methyl ester carboxylesterase
MVYQETFVQRNGHRIYVREHPGADPPIILMHGFPNNVHLYDPLVPHLAPPRRVVLFDLRDAACGRRVHARPRWRPTGAVSGFTAPGIPKAHCHHSAAQRP